MLAKTKLVWVAQGWCYRILHSRHSTKPQNWVLTGQVEHVSHVTIQTFPVIYSFMHLIWYANEEEGIWRQRMTLLTRNTAECVLVSKSPGYSVVPPPNLFTRLFSSLVNQQSGLINISLTLIQISCSVITCLLYVWTKAEDSFIQEQERMFWWTVFRKEVHTVLWAKCGTRIHFYWLDGNMEKHPAPLLLNWAFTSACRSRCCFVFCTRGKENQ